MRKLLAAALAAALCTGALADDRAPAPEAKKVEKAAKGKVRPAAKKAARPAAKPAAEPEKPCEPVKPCPID
jgi:hypothetical protein